MNIKHVQKRSKPVHMDEEAIDIALKEMESDNNLRTRPSYTNDGTNRLVPFYEKHMNYLLGHPKVNPAHYLSNLRAMIKVRP